MDKEIYDAWMAVEIASNSTKQKMIRVLYFMLGLTAGAIMCLLIRG